MLKFGLNFVNKYEVNLNLIWGNFCARIWVKFCAEIWVQFCAEIWVKIKKFDHQIQFKFVLKFGLILCSNMR